MILKIFISEIAEEDLLETAMWYEKQKQGLGEQFIVNFESCLSIIERNPKQFVARFKKFRRVLLSRFPYAVYYKILSDKVEVVGVFHQRRNIFRELKIRNKK